MPKPRVFISSTCFDLRDIRSRLDTFLTNLGLDVLNSEDSTFGVSPQVHSHTACLEEVDNSDYLVLIIGGRRGGTFIGSEKSITNEEFKRAKKRKIPIIACVDKNVFNSMATYKRNPSADFSHVVDDIRIFHFIEYISSDSENNWLHQYNDINEIEEIIQAQFAHYLFLYSKSLREGNINQINTINADLSFVEFPQYLNYIDDYTEFDENEKISLKNGLRKLHKIMQNIMTSETSDDSKREKFKVLWIMSKYGNYDYDRFEMTQNSFKQYAWSTSRNHRVAEQFVDFNVELREEYDDIDNTYKVKLSFIDQDNDIDIAWALHFYTKELCEKYMDDESHELFDKIDMRIFQ